MKYSKKFNFKAINILETDVLQVIKSKTQVIIIINDNFFLTSVSIIMEIILIILIITLN